LWGEGDGGLLNWDSDAKWLVVEVDEEDVVPLEDKVKFSKGTVIYCGNRYGATQLIAANGRGTAIVGHDAVAGDCGTATAGFRGTATAGDEGTATAGFRGTATVGFKGTATVGDYGTATAGDGGTATAGKWGTATAGFRGTATAGDEGTATVGDYGTATAGDFGTATAGDRGIIQIRYWYGNRYRVKVGYIGENGLEAGVPYVLNDEGKFVRKDQ
jgi:hypothetical protein